MSDKEQTLNEDIKLAYELAKALNGEVEPGTGHGWHHTCLRLAKEVERLRASQPQWQPIDTAPKDGSDVLAWGPRWKQPDYIHFRNGGWCEWVGLDTGEWEPITFSESFLPTHWMPIPEPPKKC